MCRLIHLKKADLFLKMSQPGQGTGEKFRDNSRIGKNSIKAQKMSGDIATEGELT